MSKLIVFEGIDGSGKSTQFKLVCNRLAGEGVRFTPLTFPQYQEPSSSLVRMYLAGEFGDSPDSVNPYAASTFFAVDRIASYLKNWRSLYHDGVLLLTDRYTTSNALHQGSKLPEDKRPEFFKWLYAFEFGHLELPKPDIVLYLDIPVEAALERIRMRASVTGSVSDIHERDVKYLKECWRCGTQAADFFDWRKISCFSGGIARSEQEIHEEIFNILKKGAYIDEN